MKKIFNNFITFEGIEGSGKSTLITLVSEELEKQKYKIFRTREPGGDEFSEKIREIILEKKDIDPITELFLFLSARREHIEKVIKPALKEYDFVFCDRFFDSSLAYQGFGRNIGYEKIKKLRELFFDDINPIITLFLNIEYKNGIARKKKQKEINRIDLESEEFFKKVKKGYQKIKSEEKQRIFELNGNEEKEKVKKKAIKIILGTANV